MSAAPPDKPREPAPEPKAQEALPCVDSAALLQGARAALIRHNGVTYRLYATRSGKLILTK
jgi:hemin uptake protein HemP